MLYDPTSRFTNSTKGSPGKGFKAGLHIAKVTRVTGSNVFVTIPSVNPGQTIGPCLVFTNATIVTGDSVLVGFLDAKLDEVVVIGKKAS
jgi:hypothetical protein